MSEFESAISEKTIFGDHRVHYGTFFASGVSGGPIFHGLTKCFHFNASVIRNSEASITSGSIVIISGSNLTDTGWSYTGSAVSGGTQVVSGTMVQVNTLTGASGIWMAYGR